MIPFKTRIRLRMSLENFEPARLYMPEGFWVGAAEDGDRDELGRIAARFGVPPLHAPEQAHYGIWLDTLGWSLHSPVPLGFSPLRLDFSSGATGYRLRQAGKRQPLGRAVGLKPGCQLHVIDATAGLGRDAGVLAQLGCNVTMIERSPILALLLEDSWKRTASPQIRGFVNVNNMDARDALSQFIVTPDVIYLDPMYPHRNKSSLVKKEMRIIRDLVGDDTDAEELLMEALAMKAKRVVVKRPRGAPTLPGPLPTRHITGPNTRYDIYETHAANSNQ